MGRETLRAQVGTLIRDINTLIVGATTEELHDILAALAASQSHATAQLMLAADMEAEARRKPEFLNARQVSALTGFSRTWLYDNGERLGIAIRPTGTRGIRFPRSAVEHWMETKAR